MMWLAFGLGLILGTVAGVLFIGLLQMGKRSEEFDCFPDRIPYRLEPLEHPTSDEEVKRPSPVL
ncbi:MAG: hypothetical protein GX443_05765 [Deltaproteobacteria bacterium]|nr:hypothetical protein [Deltaproteobacteria bacterium]